MKNINEIFKHIDHVIELGNKLAKEDPHSKDNWYNGSFRISEYENGLGYEPCEEDRMIYKTIKPNHNDDIFYFLFHTYTPYPNTVLSEEEVREKSEERKCFYNNDEVEVGITIEKRLQPPNKTVWGWEYRGYDYYVIKDGKTTISKNRAEIRRIYNNKSEWTQPNIRFKEYHSQKREVHEIEDIQEIYSYNRFDRINKVYLLETTDGEYYYIGDTDDLHHYACYLIDQDDDLKISIVGGVEEAAKRFVNGEKFDTWNWHFYSKLHEILDVEKDAESDYNKKYICGISYPYEFLNEYQIVKQL